MDGCLPNEWIIYRILFDYMNYNCFRNKFFKVEVNQILQLNLLRQEKEWINYSVNNWKCSKFMSIIMCNICNKFIEDTGKK